MREILFRGKRLINDEWIEGLLVKDRTFYGNPENHVYIVNHECPSGCFGRDIYFEVVSDTVGQYTGLNDRHAKRIFENDIVEFCGGKEQRYLIWWVREMSMLTAIPVDGISFNGHDYWNGHYPQFEYSTFCLMMQDPWGDFRDIRVIGNIHDNPELLNGSSEG